MTVLQAITVFAWISLFHTESVYGEVATWQLECLKIHNTYRAKHQTGNLTWSDSLQQEAQTWANYLGDWNLASRSEIGESLYLTSDMQLPTCGDIVTSFYKEINRYNYNNPGLSKDTERFSQLLWKSTTQLGVAYSKRKDGKYVVVFKYKSPGNYNTKSAFKQNVLPPPVKAKGSKIDRFPLILTTTLLAPMAMQLLEIV